MGKDTIASDQPHGFVIADEPAAGGKSTREGTSAGPDESESRAMELLGQLAADGAGAAWGEFLKLYSSVVMLVVRRFESGRDESTDCFLYVCEALSDDGFRRLRSYRPQGKARFRTWLSAVVANLCIDWQRRRSGRYRPVQAVADLPEIDQQVYRCIYVRGMSRADCLSALIGRYPDLTQSRLSEINARLFQTLTPQQRFQLAVRSAPRTSLDAPAYADGDEPVQVPDQSLPPDELAGALQQGKRLREALVQLPADQRLMLRLRYEQELPLAEVARLMALGDPFRANRRIQAALHALARIISK